MKLIPILSLALLAGCTTLAPQAPAPWSAVGLGDRSCREFLERPPLSSRQDPWVQWTMGYISARNARHPDPDLSIGPRDLNDPLTRDPVKWLADRCADHLETPFHRAVHGLWQKEERDRFRRRLHERSDPPRWPVP